MVFGVVFTYVHDTVYASLSGFSFSVPENAKDQTEALECFSREFASR